MTEREQCDACRGKGSVMVSEWSDQYGRTHASYDTCPGCGGEGEIEIEPLGTWIASPEQIAGSELESTVSISETGRVMVFDIASDKDALMVRISELIDLEREGSGTTTTAPRR